MFIKRRLDVNFMLAIFYGLFIGSFIPGFALSNFMLILFGIASIFQCVKNKTIKFDKNYLPLIIFFLWTVCSVVWTIDHQQTFKGIIKLISFLLIPIFFSQFPKIGNKNIIVIFRTLSISLSIYFIICLFNSYQLYISDQNINHFFYHDLTSMYNNNAIYISTFTSFTLLSMINVSKKKFYDYILVFILLFYLILLSSKNIIFTTFFIQLMIVLFFNKNKKQKQIIVGSLLSMVVIFTAFVYIDSPLKERYLVESNTNFKEILTKDFFNNYQFNGTNLRLLQLRMGIEMFLNNNVGFQGLGLSSAQGLLNDYYLYYTVPQYLSYNFHNQYMQTSIELGIIGLFLLAFILVFSFIKSIKNYNIILFSFVLLMIFLFFTESFLNRQKGILFFVFIYSLLFKFQSRNFSIKAKND
ncbi:oligosaccharide repeat unit polymerase [Apibacter muscae]|uniref:O-antigen ligase family protein n=1 Tax=Apibacter muscae TaxID=2509004 RepID=UPI0011AB99AB|nr:O-antigen polymerase [Apibacter muscae]TWP23753.1 oligosaccharide repeat unit polymerase [Apibacter muscae]